MNDLVTGQKLLSAVLENPADDGPRLVYADWCEERGELDRATFIRVQIELASLPPEAEDEFYTPKGYLVWSQRRVLGRRQWRELVQVASGEWFLPLRYTWGDGLREDRGLLLADGYADDEKGIEYVVRRGFVQSLQCRAEFWLTHADAITSQHPVEKVRLTTIVPPEFRRQVDSEDTGEPGCIIRLPGRTWRPFPDGDSPEGRLRNLLAAEWPKITFHFPS